MLNKKISLFLAFILAFAILPMVSAVCPDGLVGYYQFNNASNLSEATYGGISAEEGSPIYNPNGQVGGAVIMNGENTSFTLNYGSAITSNDSIIMWIKIVNASEERYLFNDDPRICWLHNNGSIKLAPICNIMLSTDQELVNGVWQMIAYTSNGTNVIQYIDGVQSGANNSGNINLGGGGLLGRHTGGDFHFNGSMDEVAVFNRTLNATDIAELYAKSDAGLGYCEESSCPAGMSGFGTEADPCQITSCSSLNVSDLYYELQDDLNTTGNCIGISAHNITLDLNGFAIVGDHGAGDFGIYSSNKNYTTIKNGVITNFGTGITFSFGYNLSLSNLIVKENVGSGMVFMRCHNINVTSNSINDNGLNGISLEGRSSTNNLISNNFVVNNTNGISVDADVGSIFKNNVAYYNVNGIKISGSDLGEYPTGNIVQNNTLLNNSNGLSLQTAVNNTIVINNQIYDNDLLSIDALANGENDRYNQLIYNNSYGQIKWTSLDFLGNFTVEGYLTSPGRIIIGNNTAYFNPTGMTGNINSSAEITLDLNGWGIGYPKIFRNGIACSYPTCNVSSYIGTVVVFNVPAWSNYTIGEAQCSDVLINYGYTYTSNSTAFNNGANSVKNNVIGLVDNFFSLMPTIGTILAVVVLIAVIVLLVLYAFRMKGSKTEGFTG